MILFFFFSVQNHLENCKRVPIKCINNCGRTDIPRDQVFFLILIESYVVVLNYVQNVIQHIFFQKINIVMFINDWK